MTSSRILLITAVLLVPVASHAVNTSPGKSSVFSMETGFLDATGNTPTLATGQILKGKKKTVLKIETSISVAADPALPGVRVYAVVNGYALANPTYVYSQCDVAAPNNPCTLTATHWLDIDAAELAIPGAFVGQPLNIMAGGGNTDSAGAGLGYTVTFSAIVVKK